MKYWPPDRPGAWLNNRAFGTGKTRSGLQIEVSQNGTTYVMPPNGI